MEVVGGRLFKYVADHRPDVYLEILNLIRPYSIESVTRLFQSHVSHSVPDLRVFNDNLDRVAEFCLRFVAAARKHFPQPGDAYGIQLTCRITRSDTQGTLDSKHLSCLRENGGGSSSSSSSGGRQTYYRVDKSILHELGLFSTQSQVFELGLRHRYASVFVEGYVLQDLFERLPPRETCHLERGNEFNKAKDVDGRRAYVNTFRFVVVNENGSFRILYQTVRDLSEILRRLDMRRVTALSDVRYVFKKCGILCHFFNMVNVLRRRLFTGQDPAYEKDVVAVCKYQCRSGEPLPLTREGLAKNGKRSPIEILSFEAPKKNYSRLCAGRERSKVYPVQNSADKVFFGQQFNEGTGNAFGLLPRNDPIVEQPPPPKRKIKNESDYVDNLPKRKKRRGTPPR